MPVEDDSVASWLLAEVAEDKAFSAKYELERELGFGASGLVVSARHRVLEQRVAIKFLLSGKENPEAIARFLREARAASRIRNQHVVRILDASTLASGIPYLVMEHLDGFDLERMLHDYPRRQLPITDAIDFVLQTCEALAECHSAGIVHRDLKPSNLFCVHGADGMPMIKVLDFGIAKLGTTTFEASAAEDEQPSDRRRRILGSPAYMSPEQFESSTDVDARTDIWALGVILYEFVTGQLPFQETSVYRIRKRVTEDEPPSIREARRDVPAALVPVISKCMEKQADRRFASLAELAKALSPLASARAQGSIARIVRTLEAPGGDTGSLALPRTESRRPSSGGRFSLSISAHPVRRDVWPRRLVAFGSALALLTAVGVTWRGLRHRTGGEPQPVSAFSGALQVTPPVNANERHSDEAQPTAVPAEVASSPSPNPSARPSPTVQAEHSKKDSATRGARPLPAQPSATVESATRSPPVESAPAASTETVTVNGPAGSALAAPSAEPWLTPIVEHRKRTAAPEINGAPAPAPTH